MGDMQPNPKEASPTATLRLNQRSMPVESAEMKLYISTESWRKQKTWFGIHRPTWCYGENDLTASWNIDIVVNEDSGEDGAPAPSLMFRIVPGQPFPSSLAALEGTQLHDKEKTLSEGWYGNDAPALENNSLSFGRWQDEHHLILTWSAEYDDWESDPRQRASMLFHGPVEFKGVRMRVKQEEDAARFLLKSLPTLDQQGLEVTWGPWQDLGRSMPADRRKWREVIWKMRP